MSHAISPLRLDVRCESPPRSSGRYVLYWMTAQRRTASNYGLQRACEWAHKLRQPVVVLDALRLDYPWASARFHAFVLEGMADVGTALHDAGVSYYPYVETTPGSGKGLLAALAQAASVVVTDEYPCFFHPAMLRAAATKLEVRLEAVDGNGLFPLRAFAQECSTAMAFRRAWQALAADHLLARPLAAPWSLLPSASLQPAKIDDAIFARWPRSDAAQLRSRLAALPVDQTVAPVAMRGGAKAARARLHRFMTTQLDDYLARNEPEREVSSGLSPYLHFGHLGSHEVFAALADAYDWSPAHGLGRANGRREGFWHLPAAAEAFLDQLVTWRELGYGFCHHRPDYASWSSLPPWAKATLQAHAGDPRPVTYDLAQFAAAQTHDPLWNAAQRQLVTEGTIHNYLRMLWGKKILEWSATPQQALAIMIELNNRYALDGRDPNSYAGIMWTLGRFDRPWGPERPIFGVIRYMTSQNTARKVSVKRYLQRWAPQGELALQGAS